MNESHETRKVNSPDVTDLMSVGSRIRWSAIFAGAAIALTVYSGLALLGTAIGLSVTEEVPTQGLAVGAGIWALLTMLASLFLGGVVTTMTTAGETKGEAIIYGLVLWALLFLGSLVLGSAGAIGGGFGAVVRSASGGGSVQEAALQRDALREVGLSTEQISKIEAMREEIRTQTRDVSGTEAAWWGFIGLVLSMFASLAGSLAGAGPRLKLKRVAVRRGAEPAVEAR